MWSHLRALVRLRVLRLFAFVAVGLAAVLFADLSQAIGENYLAPEENKMQSLVNQVRSSNGLAPLDNNTGLKWIARRQTQAMASAGYIYHSSDLGAQADQASLPWYTLGENVGQGPTTDAIHQAFLNSPTHRGNIVHRDFNALGIGAMADPNQILFFTQSFAGLEQAPAPAPQQPAQQPAPPQPQQDPAPTPAQAPATNAPQAPTQAPTEAPTSAPTVEPTTEPVETSSVDSSADQGAEPPERPSLIELLVAMFARFVDKIAFWS